MWRLLPEARTCFGQDPRARGGDIPTPAAKGHFEQLVTHLLLTVPDAIENPVVLQAISNAEEVDSELRAMVIIMQNT